MGQEIDLLVNYPKTKRNVQKRGAEKTLDDRMIARAFGQACFDVDRRRGYEEYPCHPRLWQPVIPTFQQFYGLSSEHSVLDIGCAKGFMLHDFRELIPHLRVAGIDISSYAIENGIESVKPFIQVADARKLPFPDQSF